MNRWRLWIPLLAFLGFVALAGVMLVKPKDEFVESRMVGKPLPYFALRPAVSNRPGVASADFASGKPRLLNVIVEPVLEAGADGLFVVAFQDVRGMAPEASQTTDGSIRSPDALAAEHELRTTRAQLQATIADLETAHEEMKSTDLFVLLRLTFQPKRS